MNHDVYNRWVRVCSFIRSFLDLQDKLHFNICRRRSLVAIGTHNLNAVKPPFYYKALPAEAVKFIPLNQTREFNGREVVVRTRCYLADGLLPRPEERLQAPGAVYGPHLRLAGGSGGVRQ